MDPNSYNNELERLISLPELTKSVASQQNNKALGPDAITNEAWKRLELCIFILSLCLPVTFARPAFLHNSEMRLSTLCTKRLGPKVILKSLEVSLYSTLFTKFTQQSCMRDYILGVKLIPSSQKNNMVLPKESQPNLTTTQLNHRN